MRDLYYLDRMPYHDRKQFLMDALTRDEENAALARLIESRSGYWSPLIPLKPCPFSGYPAHLRRDTYGNGGYYITCETSHCCCRMSIGPRGEGSLCEEWMAWCEGVDGRREKVVECDIQRISRMWNRRAT